MTADAAAAAQDAARDLPNAGAQGHAAAAEAGARAAGINAGGAAAAARGPAAGTRHAPAIRTGSRPAARGPAAAPGGRPAAKVVLTGRGGVCVMAAVFAAGLLASVWLGWTLLASLAFVAGCVLAARYTRQADLLTVAATPPLIFACALLIVKAMTAHGSLLFSVAGGSALALAASAPWLVAGVALNLVIASRRGLWCCVRDLRGALGRGGTPPGAP